MIGTPATPNTEVRSVDFNRVRRALRILEPIAQWYFRSEVRGLERVPDGPTILVTHHDGGMLPVAGMCFAVAWHRHFEFQRPLYVLAHDVVHWMLSPFRDAIADVGIVSADRVTMDGVLARGASVLVFPGAARETFRPFSERAQIDLGGRRGFVRQAMRWRVPVTPVVNAGGHETVVVLARGEAFARAVGLNRLVRAADVWPIQIGLPWGIWALPFLPPFPLPARITTEVLPPVHVAGNPDDVEAVDRGFRAVLEPMQDAVGRLYARRRRPTR